MQRWHVTLGLTCVAVAAALLAPRLAGLHAPVVQATPPQPPVVVDAIQTAPQQPVAQTGDPLGHL